MGIDPYPPRFKRAHTAKQAVDLLVQIEQSGKTETTTVTVAGRIMAKRTMGKVSFLDIRDDSGKIQLLIGKDRINEAGFALFKELDIGDIIGASGRIFRTRTEEPTIEVTALTLLSKSLQPLPEKWHGLSDVDIRFRQRYLDLISNEEVRKTFRTRSKIITDIRRLMAERGFIEVETPILLPEAGGTTAKPFVTHYNALDND